MASSYSRRCRYCDRWISMRQMPAGQWVAFENNSPHDCETPPIKVKQRSPKPTAPSPSSADTRNIAFDEFEIKPTKTDLTGRSPVSTPESILPRQIPSPPEPTHRAEGSSSGFSWWWILVLFVALGLLWALAS
jgi:hypothetical protein